MEDSGGRGLRWRKENTDVLAANMSLRQKTHQIQSLRALYFALNVVAFLRRQGLMIFDILNFILLMFIARAVGINLFT